MMDIDTLRSALARETDSPYDYPFFWASWRVEGEVRDAAHARQLGRGLADAMLLDLFNTERPHHDSDTDTVLVLCHG